jgi:hypothetical protein
VRLETRDYCAPSLKRSTTESALRLQEPIATNGSRSKIAARGADVPADAQVTLPRVMMTGGLRDAFRSGR